MQTLKSSLVLTAILMTCACAPKITQREIRESQVVHPPQASSLSLTENLLRFSAMLQAYLAGAEQDIVVEIPLIHNELAKSLPTDMGLCGHQALNDSGIKTVRGLPPWYLLPAAGLGFMELPKQASTYRATGMLGFASEMVRKGRDARADAESDGKPDALAVLALDGERGISNITIQLALEHSATGIITQGGITQYSVIVERLERNGTASIYINGSGIGGGSRVAVTQNAHAAVCGAIAAGIIQLLGRAVQVPYYRVAPTIFGIDDELKRRVSDSMNRLARTEIEQNVKRYMFIDGHPMNMASPSLTSEDRAIIVAEMRQASLSFENRSDLLEHAVTLWQNLDYEQGAQRVERRLAESERDQRERQLAQPFGAPKPPPQPSSLKPQSVWMVSIDATRLPSVALRKQVAATIARCNGCTNMTANETVTQITVHVSTNPVEVYEVLRRSSLKVLIAWATQEQDALIVAPFGAAIRR